jgi:hypothetical protein
MMARDDGRAERFQPGSLYIGRLVLQSPDDDLRTALTHDRTANFLNWQAECRGQPGDTTDVDA